MKKNGGILDMLKLELTGFADELDVEKEKSLKINSKVRVAFSWVGKTEKGTGLGEMIRSSVWGMLSLKCILDIHVESVSRQLTDEAGDQGAQYFINKCVIDRQIRKEMYKTEVWKRIQLTLLWLTYMVLFSLLLGRSHFD